MWCLRPPHKSGTSWDSTNNLQIWGPASASHAQIVWNVNDGKYVELFGKPFVLGQFGTISQIRKSISASNEGSMDGDSISGPESGAICRSQKGLETGQRMPLRKNLYHMAWISKSSDSADGTGLLLIQSTNQWSSDFSFEYYSKSKMSNRRREPWNWQVGSQSLRKMPPEVRRQKKTCVRMTITSDRKDITVLAFLSLYLVCPSPPKSLYLVSEEGKKISSSVIRRSVSLRSRMTWQCGRAKHLSLSDWV